MKTKQLTYTKSGVNYNMIDPLKRMAQQKGRQTASNIDNTPFTEIDASRGESAYVLEAPDHYMAFVQEGLGTKSLVADEMYKLTGKTYYDNLAQDTVAMIVNDLITVGARPLTILAYWATGSSDWFKDEVRMSDLINGWATSCTASGATWGGGETPTLVGVIEKDTIDLAGSAFGIIKPKSRLVLEDNLKAGDAIVVFQSSGIHANGLTLARVVADSLSQGYATKMPSGTLYGEALLQPTVLYAKLIQKLFDANISIHYMANITGHGWRKLMRSTKQFTYNIHTLVPVPEVLEFICKKGPVRKKEAYANFNMGAGFAVYVSQPDVIKVKEISEELGIHAHHIGDVDEGEKRVIIEPLDVTYSHKELRVKA